MANSCSFCKSYKIINIIDFKKVGLAGSFLKKNQIKKEKKYPLKVGLCKNCFAFQVLKKIDPKTVFSKYFYFSSSIKTLQNYFSKVAYNLSIKYEKFKNSNILEIGCNDGVLIKPLQNKGFKKIFGIDPAKNIQKKINLKNLKIINDFFSNRLSNSIKKSYGKFDMILANNVFAHINNIRDVVRGIKNLLTDRGVFIFEVHYLGKMIKELQYDMIYHEHIYYYSLISAKNLFAQFDMIIIDYEFTNIHAGSIRFTVTKNNEFNKKKITKKIIKLEKNEITQGFKKINFYKKFNKNIQIHKKKLLNLVNKITKKKDIIYGYGASGRANTVLQNCSFDSSKIKLMIDDAKSKWNFYTPGSHIKITNKKILKKKKPDYLLIFAWSFYNEIVNNNILHNIKIIIPFPKPIVLK